MPDTDNTNSVDKICEIIGFNPIDLPEYCRKEIASLIAQEANKATDRLLHEVIEQLPNAGGRLADEAGGYNDAIEDVVAVLNTYLRGGNHERRKS